jgi:GNAT superfamily N-acetyltransferase
MNRSRTPVLHPRGVHAADGYCREYERDVTLADGRTVHLRPIVPGDIDALRDAIAEADRETLRNRFLGGRPPAAEEELEQLVRVDYDRRFAVVALSDSRRGVGIARYEADGAGTAEVAVAVDPGWRRVGLATELLKLLAEAALDHGVTQINVEFLLANVDVASILRDSHLPVALHHDHGVAQAEVDITSADIDPRLASGARGY